LPVCGYVLDIAVDYLIDGLVDRIRYTKLIMKSTVYPVRVVFNCGGSTRQVYAEVDCAIISLIIEYKHHVVF